MGVGVRQAVPINLFKPGMGVAPPFLAGRERAIEAAAPLLAGIKGGEAPASCLILHGPRGNGKTVLLDTLLSQLKDIARLQLFNLTPDQIPTLPALCHILARKGAEQWILDRLKAIKTLELTVEVKRPDASRLLADVLRDRLEAGPLVVAIDEAHALDSGVGQALLNAVQIMLREGRPLLLILAGTPDLKDRLMSMEASFWGRSEDVPIGLLDADGASRAITEPLKPYEVSFASEALARVVAESNGYPFFLQLWGQALCADLGAGTRLGTAHVASARPAFELRRNQYYADRHRELSRHGLLSAARAVAVLFQAAPAGNRLSEDDMLAALNEAAGVESAKESLYRLNALGLIWDGDRVDYAPGIPSLITYVAEQAPGAASENA